MSAYMHIYAQPYWHQSPYIVANRAAILALRAALDRALSEGFGHSESFTADGEGYNTLVILRETEMEGMRLPYTDECAISPYGELPYKLIPNDRCYVNCELSPVPKCRCVHCKTEQPARSTGALRDGQA